MRRLTFSIRDVFWLTVVLGMALGWWAHANELSGKAALSNQWKNHADSLQAMLELDGWAVLRSDKATVYAQRGNETRAAKQGIFYYPHQ